MARRPQLPRLHTARWMLPTALAASAATLFTVGASGDELSAVGAVPRLVCDSGERIVTFFDYATTIEESPVFEAPVDATERLVAGRIINDQPGHRAVVQLDQRDGELPVAMYRSDGSAAAVVYFEGNERYGWRPARSEACS